MARPSGAATTVSGPLNSRTAPLSRAAARALSSFDSGAPLGERPLGSNSRANSPACGVSTTGPGAALIACQSLSGSSEKLVSASASSTKAREDEPPLSAVSTFSRVAAETPSPGPSATTFLRASRQQFRERRRVVGLAQHDAGERAGVYRHRVPWTCESDEPGPRPQRRRRREPRRAGE